MLTLFSKTYVNDYPWLKLAIKTVLKLCKDPVEWTIVGDAGAKSQIQDVVLQAVQESKGILKFHIHEVLEHWPECGAISNGYLAQQWVKMNSHRVMPDGLYWNWDSDVIAIKPFSTQSFVGKSGRPIYWISQFNSIMNGVDRPAHEGRIALVKEIFGLTAIPTNYIRSEIPFEYMRCMPVPLYGNLLKICSERVEWKRSLEVLKSGDHRFSEFNIIGQAFHCLFPEAFEWHNAESDGGSWACGYVEGGVGSGMFQEHGIVCQGWSWGGIPQHIKDFVDNL